MSAIAGILHMDGSPVPGAHLDQMAEALRHRAPDGFQVLHGGMVGLVHGLLVVDEATFRPLIRDGVSLVMDGRIDNLELIRRAAARRRWRVGEARRRVGEGDSDSGTGGGTSTESIVMDAYREFGADLPRWLMGDFALAAWDERCGRLILARDPIGVKPLFYYRDERRFLFASEAKAILNVEGVPCRPCRSRLEEYERFKFRSLESTFFAGIRRVLPGERLCVEGGRARRQVFWMPPQRLPVSSLAEAAWLGRFRQTFLESVRRRLPSRGSIALTLSGGLDSTSIAAAAVHAAPHSGKSRLHALSVVFGGFENETDHFTAAARSLNLPSTVVDAEDVRPAEHLSRLVVELESPFVEVQDPNLYFGLFAAASRLGARRVFTGFWGDQMMAGMGFLGDLIREGEWGRFSAELRRIDASCVGSPREAIRRTLRYLLFPNTMGPIFPTCNQRELYGSLFGCYHSMTLESFDMGAAARHAEVCFPFLDRRLVEMVFRMPAQMRVRRGIGKWLLREGLEGILPDRTAKRLSKAVATAFWDHKLEESGFGNGSPGRAMKLWRAAARRTWEDAWFGNKTAGR